MRLLQSLVWQPFRKWLIFIGFLMTFFKKQSGVFFVYFLIGKNTTHIYLEALAKRKNAPENMTNRSPG